MKRLNERISQLHSWRTLAVEPLVFTAPYPLQTCADTIRAHQKMPEGGALGIWIDMKAMQAEKVLLECKLFGNYGPFAWYEIELVKINDESTRVTVVTTMFNTLDRRIDVLVVCIVIVVTIVGRIPFEKLLGLFMLYAVFSHGIGVVMRERLRKARRFPGQMRLWLDERANPLAQ